MNELTFLHALSNGGLQKEAGVGEYAKATANVLAKAIRDRAPQIGAAMIGAAAAGGGQYLMSRPRSGGRPSVDQSASRAAARATAGMAAEAKKDKRPLSFREDIQAATAPAVSAVADVGARHPGKAALLAAPAGALAGLAILKMIK
jgi:hypothetical protein